MRLLRTLLGLVAAIFFVGVVGFGIYAWHPEITASDQSAPPSFERALIERGAQLALIGNCNSCHTKAGGAPYAGGRPMATPFGTIHATNITPDRETGIGRWSEAAFLRSMREGVRRDGAHLYPAFPYDHFTKVSTHDVRAIYAFLMTREPVHARTPDNQLPFPLNVRPVIAGWKLLYFRQGEFQPDPQQTVQINRGAYLVEGLAHCGGCHTPRNALGAEQQEQAFAGGESEGWHAPALNAGSPAPTPWTTEQLAAYLQRGFVERHGVAAGPMQPVVNNLGRVPEEDVKAIAAYVGTLLVPATTGRQAATGERRTQIEHENAARPLVTTGTTGSANPPPPDGATIYAGACALCHESTGQRFSAHGIPLALSKVLNLPDARNLVHVVLQGIEAPIRSPAATMPGFAEAMTDEQVVALVSYLRANFTDQPAWSDVENHVRTARRTGG
jgi:mono/diheme cytochrome c family protein